jgi:hypothetical protein
MTFDEAHRKEKWFFDTLFADDLKMRELCDINNFRRKLVSLYEEFVAAQIKLAAPRVFDKVVEYCRYMWTKWDWGTWQECFENSHMVKYHLDRLIQGMVRNGKKTSLPTSAAEILIRQDVLKCAAKCSSQFLDPATALQNTKQEYIRLMANVTENLIEQVHCSTSQCKEFKRYMSLGCHVVKVIVFIVEQFLEQAEETFDKLISHEEERYQHVEIHMRPVEGMVCSLIKCGQSQLAQLGAIIDNLPLLPTQYILLDPPKVLEHATPKVETLRAPFGLTCDASGVVSSSVAKVPTGSIIVQIAGAKFSLELMLEMSNSTDPVRFAYVEPDCSIISDDANVSAPLLYHEEHVSCEFLQERERFQSLRRAAELLTLVFNSETTRFGKPIAERGEFEQMVHGCMLICLHPTDGDDPDWYKENHHGTLPPPVYNSDFVVKQPGMCCTIGCVRTHDTAFNPCGHTVCCWECAKKVHKCPVCTMDLTRSATGFRAAKDLCYDHLLTEPDHLARVRLGEEHDVKSRQAIEDEYQKVMIKFMPEDDLDGQSVDTARLALEERSRQRAATLAARGDGTGRLPKQAHLWPRFDELEKERARSAQEKQTITQRFAEAHSQKETQMQQLEQAHRDTQQQLREQHIQQRAAMLHHVKTLEDVLRKTDIRMKSNLLAPAESDGHSQCTQCSVVFLPGEGLLSSGKVSAYNCAACGDAFCDECAPSPGFVFKTGGKDKVQRVCRACRAALEESGGARSRLIPAERPDGTRFGS